MPPLTRNVSSGHGVKIAFAIPDAITGAAGAYVFIGNVLGDVKKPSLKVETKDVTGHDDTRVKRLPASVVDLGEMSISVNSVPGSAAHDAATGLEFHVQQQTLLYWRFWGPLGAEDEDEWIFTGYITNVQETLPAKVGQRTLDLTITPSGDDLMIDGVAQ